MNFMPGLMLLYKKELRYYFKSPLVYIVGGLFSLLMGWLFFNYMLASKEYTPQLILHGIIIPVFANMNFIFLFLIPLLTMKVFSEESKNGTLDLLLRSKMRTIDIIMAKYLAMGTICFFLLSLTLIFPIILSFAGFEQWQIVMSCYLGVSLCLFFYLSIGIFASSLTENQVLASIISFCMLLFFVVLVVTGQNMPNYIVGQIFQYLSPPFHYETFLRGSWRSFNFAYFLSGIGIFLYSTNISLKSRSW